MAHPQESMPLPGAPPIGQAIRRLRGARGLTIGDLSEATGLSEATLSRIENGRTDISAHNLYRLSAMLDVDVSAFFGGEGLHLARGARSVSRRGEAPEFVSDRFLAEILSVDLLRKKMLPFINTVSGRSLDEAGGCRAHEGEEFLYVLSGTLVLHSEHYSPLLLNEGDSVYFDGNMGHAYVSGGEEPARILVVNTSDAIVEGLTDFNTTAG